MFTRLTLAWVTTAIFHTCGEETFGP